MPSSNIKRKKKPGPSNASTPNGGSGNYTETAMDEFLGRSNLYRKPIAKDGSCLFRAVSEQVSSAALFTNTLKVAITFDRFKDLYMCFFIFIFRHSLLETFEILFSTFLNALLLYLFIDFVLIDVLLYNKQIISWHGFSDRALIEHSIDT